MQHELDKGSKIVKTRNMAKKLPSTYNMYNDTSHNMFYISSENMF